MYVLYSIYILHKLRQSRSCLPIYALHSVLGVRPMCSMYSSECFIIREDTYLSEETEAAIFLFCVLCASGVYIYYTIYIL